MKLEKTHCQSKDVTLSYNVANKSVLKLQVKRITVSTLISVLICAISVLKRSNLCKFAEKIHKLVKYLRNL